LLAGVVRVIQSLQRFSLARFVSLPSVRVAIEGQEGGFIVLKKSAANLTVLGG
jgi:hypothetical protein